MAIKGIHTMFFSSDAEATRAFLRDVLQLPHVDVGEGWLIFNAPGVELGVHPVDPKSPPPTGTHDVSFYVEDIEAEVAALKRG